MDTGCCVAGGSRRSSAASLSSRPASKVSLGMTVSIASGTVVLEDTMVVS
jgi:hypothetical protein